MTAEIRAFRRADGEQVTALVNAHVRAVVPGVSVPQNAVLAQLERDPGEFIVDPWVAERRMLVAEERGRIVAAALLHRYAADERVSESYRESGSIHWLLCWRDAPFWPDASVAGALLMQRCVRQLADWNVRVMHAGGELPSPVIYGVSESWPHVIDLYEQAGFAPEGHVEIIFAANVADIPRPVAAPVEGLSVSREMGINGTRFSAIRAGCPVGFAEVESDLTRGGTRARFAGWADVGNLEIDRELRRQGIGSWLFGHAAQWLDVGRVDRLLAYAWPEQEAMIAFLLGCGFRELARTRRGWTRPIRG